jgi:hypothetical protein
LSLRPTVSKRERIFMAALQNKRPESPIVLFYAAGVRHRAVKEWLPVSERLKAGGHESVFIVDDICPQEWLEKCERAGVHYRVLNGSKGNTTKNKAGRPVNFGVQAKGGLLRSAAKYAPFSSWIGTWMSLRKQIKLAAELIERERPAVIVISSDTFSNELLAIVKIANKLNIPTFVCPLSMTVPAKGSMEHRRESPDFFSMFSVERRLNRIAAMIFPEWVHDFYGARMFFYPLKINTILWLMRMLVPHPYSAAGGFATRVAVTSKMGMKILTDEGVSEDKMVITGATYFDSLAGYISKADEQRDLVRKNLGIDSRKKILLLNVPHHGDVGLWSWDVQIREIEFLLQTFAKVQDIQVVMSFHPGSHIDRYAEPAKKYDAVISIQHDIVQLASVCDIFVSELSTTLHLSIGAHKPTLLLYYFNYPFRTVEYDRAVEAAYQGSGITLIKKRDALPLALQRLVFDQEFYKQQIDAQEQIAPEWILMDGLCAERIANEIASLFRMTDDRVTHAI